MKQRNVYLELFQLLQQFKLDLMNILIVFNGKEYVYKIAVDVLQYSRLYVISIIC